VSCAAVEKARLRISNVTIRPAIPDGGRDPAQPQGLNLTGRQRTLDR
jgi:hypothetical protein